MAPRKGYGDVDAGTRVDDRSVAAKIGRHWGEAISSRIAKHRVSNIWTGHWISIVDDQELQRRHVLCGSGIRDEGEQDEQRHQRGTFKGLHFPLLENYTRSTDYLYSRFLSGT